MLKKKGTIFIGYYGMDNIGDDVFCVVADWIANRYWGISDYSFLEYTRNKVGGEKLPKLYFNKNCLDYNNSRLNRIKKIIYSKRIIYLGGSVFFSRIKSLGDKANIINLSRILGAKIYALGVSLGPFKKSEDFNSIKNYLSKFSYVSTRDYPSCKLGEKMKFEKTVLNKSFDMALLLPVLVKDLKLNMGSHSVEKSRITIGISICHYETYNNGNILIEKQREDVLERLLNKICSTYQNVELRFFEFNGNKVNGDAEISNIFIKKFTDRCNVTFIPYDKDTLSFWNKMTQCNLFIGFRLHSAILSYASNIPFILFEYHRKCTDFLDEIGYDNKYRIDINNFDENSYIEQVGKLISNEIEYKLSPDEASKIVMEDVKRCPNYF